MSSGKQTDSNQGVLGLSRTQIALFPELTRTSPRPFLKWAGGKQQLLPELLSKRPQRFERYFEPFLGGGAFFFALGPERAFLSDANEELVLTFQAVREEVEEVIRSLGEHRNSKAHFLSVRAQKPEQLTRPERAARLIYLNRTCYNGLYRVNRKGQFNTPYGGTARVNISNPSVLRTASELLQRAELRACGFEEAVRTAAAGDFVYLDPPYIPVSRYSDFKRYHMDFFGREQHVQLARLFADLDRRGCLVMLSNSYSEESLELYKGWKIEVVMAKRLINKNSSGRGGVREILVTNYQS